MGHAVWPTACLHVLRMFLTGAVHWSTTKTSSENESDVLNACASRMFKPRSLCGQARAPWGLQQACPGEPCPRAVSSQVPSTGMQGAPGSARVRSMQLLPDPSGCT